MIECLETQRGLIIYVDRSNLSHVELACLIQKEGRIVIDCGNLNAIDQADLKNIIERMGKAK